MKNNITLYFLFCNNSMLNYISRCYMTFKNLKNINDQVFMTFPSLLISICEFISYATNNTSPYITWSFHIIDYRFWATSTTNDQVGCVWLHTLLTMNCSLQTNFSSLMICTDFACTLMGRAYTNLILNHLPTTV